MNCPHCLEALSERGVFCKACGGQAKCLNCKEVLEPGAAACVECGTRVGQPGEGLSAEIPKGIAASPAHLNTLNYSEDRNKRNFEAKLTDSAMQGLGDVLGEFFAQRGQVRTTPAQTRLRDIEVLSPRALPSDTTPQPDEMEIPADVAASPIVASPERARLLKIFTVSGDSFELSDNRLKAKSGAEYLRRLTYIFLYAHEIWGRTSVSETEVKGILKSGKIWDESGNANRWLNKRNGIKDDSDEKIKLLATGREEAIRTLNEALDPAIVDVWSPDKNTPKPRKKKAAK